MQINPKKYSLSPSAERTLGVYVILVVLKTRAKQIFVDNNLRMCYQ